MDDREMTAAEAEAAHLRGPETTVDHSLRRMQDLRKLSRDYPFICPVDFLPHKGSPPGRDPNDDPTFVERHDPNDDAHYTG